MRPVGIFCCLLTVTLVVTVIGSEDASDKKDKKVDEEKVEYAKGSVCQYCTYCEFCQLCQEQCPCESSHRQPACHMCKYCTYCKFCKICDTICLPGGIVDTITGSLVSMLPTFDKEVIDSDIAGVRSHIDKKKEEL